MKYKSSLMILGHIFLIVFVIWIILLILSGVNFIFWGREIVYDFIITCLIYVLGYTRTKIYEIENILVRKKIIDIDKDEFVVEEISNKNLNTVVEKEEKVILCKKCNYQVFPDEKECANCGEPVNGRRNYYDKNIRKESISAKEKLKELKELVKEGLISEKEYNQKKKQILGL